MRLHSPRLSRRGYVALTIAGIVLPTLFLGFLGLRLVQQHSRFQSEILAEYGRFSVEYAASEIERAITSEERDIANYLQLAALVDGFQPGSELRRAELSYPLIENAFLRRMDGGLTWAQWTPLPETAPEELRAREGGDLGARARAERILGRVLDDPTVTHVMLSGSIHFYSGLEDGEPYHITVFPYRDSRNLQPGLLGFFLDTENVRQEVVGRVLDESIDTAKGRFAPDFGRILTLVVRDEKNQAVHTHQYPSHAPGKVRGTCPKRDLVRADLSDVLPGWKVGITYARASGFGWTRRIVRLQVALLLLAAATVVVGTLVTMRFVLRQMELSRVKSHFVSNITHELKTPLAAIRLYTETLQQSRVRDRGEADRFLGIIHKETGRLTSLINNILDFSRIEDGRRRYTFAPASVGTIVREVVDSYSYQMQQRGFELQVEVEDGLPDALVDRDAVSQAVLNLLDNAVKYSRDLKELRVAVRREEPAGADANDAESDGGNGAENALDGGGRNGGGNGGANGGNGRGNGARGGAILVRVSDRGIGIPPAEQRRIFEAFYRVEKDLEHDVKGSGLGLAVVKHIAEAHGGSVDVESRPGAGSTFTLRLPIAESAA